MHMITALKILADTFRHHDKMMRRRDDSGQKGHNKASIFPDTGP